MRAADSHARESPLTLPIPRRGPFVALESRRERNIRQVKLRTLLVGEAHPFDQIFPAASSL
jgi:hypothetical protein